MEKYECNGCFKIFRKQPDRCDICGYSQFTFRYDSKEDTLKHIRMVQGFLAEISYEIGKRAGSHDKSKLEPPEKEYFDKFTPLLSGVTYGSDEYRNMLKEMKPAIEHHQANNRHHPEHFDNGINGMNLIDIIEMFCDFKAASLRHDDGDIRKSIAINGERHFIDEQLLKIFYNTVQDMGW